MFMSKIKFSFLKAIFTRDIAMVSGEKKSNLCSFYIGRMSTTTSFDLWMSKEAYDVFTLIINFLGND